MGHEARILAPFDPDDALSRSAAPRRAPAAAGAAGGPVALGRTVGFPANGAVSNMALTRCGGLRAAPGAADGRL